MHNFFEKFAQIHNRLFKRKRSVEKTFGCERESLRKSTAKAHKKLRSLQGKGQREVWNDATWLPAETLKAQRAFCGNRRGRTNFSLDYYCGWARKRFIVLTTQPTATRFYSSNDILVVFCCLKICGYKGWAVSRVFSSVD